MGKLIHMLSHEMKRNQPIDKVIKADLTIMQKHILKFILLETMQKDLYQKDIEEEFQIRKSTMTGYVQLMEKNGYLTRESVKGDARKKRLVPTEKAEGLRQAILEDITSRITRIGASMDCFLYSRTDFNRVLFIFLSFLLVFFYKIL